MSQEVMIAGALFSDVPSIRVPDSNGNFHPFTDVSDTTAAAADVASGKYFYAADGTRTAGTSSGGGGGTPIVGALRSDAELVKRWTYDKMIVADEGIAIPAYTSAATTLKSSEAIETVATDFGNYYYMVALRWLAYPVYNTETIQQGRFIGNFGSYIYEYVNIPPGEIVAQGKTATVSPAIITSNRNYSAYWYTGSAFTISTSYSYGIYLIHSSPSLSSQSDSLTVESPRCNIRGNSTSFSQTYWSATTDIRYQYILELYRTPKDSDVSGFAVTSQIMHAIRCLQTGDHTLT